MADYDAKVLVNEDEKADEEYEISKIYGSTADPSPFRNKKSILSEDSIVVKIEDVKKDGKFVDRLRPPDDALSKDSDSLIQDVRYSSVDESSLKCWWAHPKVKENWRTVLSAFVLFLIGLGLILTGIVVEILPHIELQGFVFLIAGAICFIPGAYHVVYIYCAVKGKRGYDFYHLPLFN